MTAPIVQQFSNAFLENLDRLNQDQSRTLDIVRINAQGNRENARSKFVWALQEVPTDIVVSVATMASQVAKQVLQSKNIPLVFMCVTDPVGAGLIQKVGTASNDNITGKIHYISVDTKIELVMSVIKQSRNKKPIRFGYIYTDYPADLSDLKRLTSATKQRNDMIIIPYKIPYKPVLENKVYLLQEIKKAAMELKNKIDYFWSPRGMLTVLPEYDDILLSHPGSPLLVGATEESVKKGALIHLTGDPASQAEDVARICTEILNGKDPGQIIVSSPRKFQFSINLSTARKLKLSIPSEIVELAAGRLYQ